MIFDFAVTFCCQELQTAMIKRDYWFEFDLETNTTILIDSENRWSGTCPFCHRDIEDMVDVDIDKKGVLLK